MINYLKKQSKNLIIICLILTTILFINRIKSKEFSSFIPNSKNYINSCIINSIGHESLKLEGEKLVEFISVLEDTHYYSKGKYRNVLIGNLYHIEFINRSNNMQNVVLTMIISDKNVIYIGGKQYDTSSKSPSIVHFLSSLY